MGGYTKYYYKQDIWQGGAPLPKSLGILIYNSRPKQMSNSLYQKIEIYFTHRNMAYFYANLRFVPRGPYVDKLIQMSQQEVAGIS